MHSQAHMATSMRAHTHTQFLTLTVWSGQSVCHTWHLSCQMVWLALFLSALPLSSSFVSSCLTSQKHVTKAQPYHKQSYCDRCALLINTASGQTHTHPHVASDHPHLNEPLGQTVMHVVMATKYSSNYKWLSGYTISWGKFIACLCPGYEHRCILEICTYSPSSTPLIQMMAPPVPPPPHWSAQTRWWHHTGIECEMDRPAVIVECRQTNWSLTCSKQ